MSYNFSWHTRNFLLKHWAELGLGIDEKNPKTYPLSVITALRSLPKPSRPPPAQPPSELAGRARTVTFGTRARRRALTPVTSIKRLIPKIAHAPSPKPNGPSPWTLSQRAGLWPGCRAYTPGTHARKEEDGLLLEFLCDPIKTRSV
jgi:hypothetical protein